MSRIVKMLVQLGLATLLLLSFGAAGYGGGLNDDGDENLGIAVVLADAKNIDSQREHARRSSITQGTSSDAQKFGSPALTFPSPLQSLGSPQLPVPLRT